jgi:hypothetical protein
MAAAEFSFERRARSWVPFGRIQTSGPRGENGEWYQFRKRVGLTRLTCERLQRHCLRRSTAPPANPCGACISDPQGLRSPDGFMQAPGRCPTLPYNCAIKHLQTKTKAPCRTADGAPSLLVSITCTQHDNSRIRLLCDRQETGEPCVAMCDNRRLPCAPRRAKVRGADTRNRTFGARTGGTQTLRTAVLNPAPLSAYDPLARLSAS